MEEHRDLRRFWFWPLLFGAAGMGLAFHPMLFSGLAQMQADPGDTRHLNYVLEHAHRAVFNWPGYALWSPAIFFPAPNTGAYTELMLGVLPFYAPFRLLGAEPDTAFQLWMLTVAALNFVAGYQLLRRAPGASRLAASAGSFVFAFATPRLSQLNHQHLIPHFFTALCVLSLWKLLDSKENPRAWLVCFFGALTAQLYAGLYLAWFFLFGLLLFTLCALAFRKSRQRLLSVLRRHLPALALGAAACAVACAPLGLHYLEAAKTVGVRDWSEALPMIPRVQSWLNLGWESHLYGWTHRFQMFSGLPLEHEHRLGLGLFTTGAVAAGFYPERKRPWVRALLWAMAGIFLLTVLWRGGHSLWRVVFEVVPGAKAFRAVSRIGLLMLLPAAFGMALFVDRARATGKAWLGVGLVLLLAVAEQSRLLGHYSKQAARADVHAVATQVPPGCRAFYFVPHKALARYEWLQLDGMWAQLATGVPTVNGYSSNFPPGWFERLSHVEDAQSGKAGLDVWLAMHAVAAGEVCVVTTLQHAL